MTISTTAPWHKSSFDHFLNEHLPQLLAEHVPLIGYTLTTTDQYTCQVQLTLASSTGEVQVAYAGLPQPDQDGIFVIKGKTLVVVPYATSDDLEQAEIFCVGEQLYEYLRSRLGKAPDDLPWDTTLAKAWLPLDLWICEFFESPPKVSWSTADAGWTTFVQSLDQTNWLARHSHLRRLAIKNRQHLFTPGHFGRACPFETPEGPNIGRIVQLALGSEIRSGKLLIVDERPETMLGLEAAMIPLLEHNTPGRLLMGTNMLRQWIVPPSPEPALIQSGNEPDAADFWCGRNILTAFVSWGADTYEDGIVLSASCAQRLSYDHPVEPGDKLSNRHGVKGVVSRILPDAEMPHLANGTPVELIFNFISQHARAYFGQIREAVLSCIAHAEGKPMIIPPFHAPDEQQIRAWLLQSELPADGMEQLTNGRTGAPLTQPSTVGWVYWGKLVHEARPKLQVTTDANGQGQQLNEYDYYALREAGAFETIRELFNTSAIGHGESYSLAERVAQGKIEQAGPPSPQLSTLLKCLAAIGIRAELQENGLAFHLSEPEGATLALASPIAHPWLRDHMLTRLGAYKNQPAYQEALVAANTRLQHILSNGAPASLRQQAEAQLALRVQEYCAALQPTVQFDTRTQFSGRAVLAPGTQLHLDQVGLAEELAWSLFGPLVRRELSLEEVQARSERATSILDEFMARTWVIIHRAPAFTPQTFLAFHPVRHKEPVIRLHPLACRLLQADFDGDQAAIFLPLTDEGQHEAGKRLSVAGHLAHTPDLLRDLVPNNEALWGLASLSLTTAGKEEIAAMLGMPGMVADEILTRAVLEEILQQVIQRDGVSGTLERLEQLVQRGFAIARASGASISPFIGNHCALPTAPAGNGSTQWALYQQEVSEWLATNNDYTNPDLGPQLLAVKSGAWGEIGHLTALLSTQGAVRDIHGTQVPIRHGYRDGLQPAEIYALAIGGREAFAQVQQAWQQIMQEIRQRDRATSFHVLARAMRAEQPAIVLAHAASIEEIDPLTDRDSRLFVGLPAYQAVQMKAHKS
jgi:hypothetical protein